MEPDEPILKEAANLIFQHLAGGRTVPIYPKGGIYPARRPLRPTCCVTWDM